MATYRKTAKGIAEISTRANKLPQKVRTALILVDGRRTDGELSSMLPLEADTSLQWLSDTGFIELADSSANASQWGQTTSGAASSLHAPTVPGPLQALAQASEARDLIELIQRGSVRHLAEQLGPMADQLAIRIERSQSRAELKPLLEIGFQVLSNVRGAQVAEEFHAKYLEEL